MPALSSEDKLIIHSRRAERLTKSVLDEFSSKTAIHINLLSSVTTELVYRLKAGRDRTPELDEPVSRRHSG